MSIRQPKLNELHGGEVEWAVSERFDIPITEIISFASTVCPLVPESVNSLTKKLRQLYLYPARDHEKLKGAILRHQGLNGKEAILLGCGSTELIHLFAQVIVRDREAIIPIPTYSEYEVAVTRYGGTPILVEPGRNFSLDMEGIERAISHRTSAIFVCNPNNPTGRLVPKEELRELATLAKRHKLVLVVDEAYLSFASDSRRYSLSSLVNSHPILVLNSLSKLFGVPSLRLGWGIGTRTIIASLEAFKIPWTISNPAVWAGEELLFDVSHQQRVRSMISSERDTLNNQLGQIAWLKVWPTDCNFYLLEIVDPNLTAEHVFNSLVKMGIVVRDCSSMKGLNEKFFRVTIRTPTENRKLVSALKELTVPIIAARR